ncbi:MAG: hypothetical protein ACE5E7_11690 [Anaerolineae bacterium]
MKHRWLILLASSLVGVVMVIGVLSVMPGVRAWDEEDILYFDPLDTTVITDRVTISPTVSTIHFDTVGALAIAAGFSVEDAAVIQAYSQATDSGNLPTVSPVYTFDADPVNYPTPPSITQVTATPYCPSPETTADFVTMGNYDVAKDQMECPGCFTSRFGPYGVFFHFPHTRSDELYATRDWAFGRAPQLTGTVIYAYSSTAQSFYQEAINIYNSSNCFVSRTATIDTGSIQPGSPQALGIYLHSLGDNQSHGDCIAAADADNKLFAAHVHPSGPSDPLTPCRWLSHELEFGPPSSDTNRTFNGILAVYDALLTYATETGRNVYRPIPIDAEGNHIYDAIYSFVYETGAASDPNGPMNRRIIMDDLRNWALQTRVQNPAYWPQVFLPVILSTG